MGGFDQKYPQVLRRWKGIKNFLIEFYLEKDSVSTKKIAMKRHFEWVRDRETKFFDKSRKQRKSWVKLTTWVEKIIVKKSFDKRLQGVVKNKRIFYGQVDRKGCTPPHPTP